MNHTVAAMVALSERKMATAKVKVALSAFEMVAQRAITKAVLSALKQETGKTDLVAL